MMMQKEFCNVGWRDGDGDDEWRGATAGRGPDSRGVAELDEIRMWICCGKTSARRRSRLSRANLTLTDAEATKFWPVYDQYTAELVKINDAKYAAIKEYATNYDTLTDDEGFGADPADSEGVDQSVAQLRQKYVPIFNKVVPGKKTALFFQLDRRLVLLIDLQIMAAIPMVQQ